MLASSSTAAWRPGGVNFDAKVRRESFEPIDLLVLCPHQKLGLSRFHDVVEFARIPRSERGKEGILANPTTLKLMDDAALYISIS
jgi:hypothetical protein